MASLGSEGAIMTQVARRVETLHETASCPPVFHRSAAASVRGRVTPAAGGATMPTTYAAINRFPGTVSALLAWADGDTDRLTESATTFCAEAPALLRSLARDVAAGNAQAVSRAAHSLYGRLAPFGVPQLRTVTATLEDYAHARDLGPAAALVDELSAALGRFCDYLVTKPWTRY